MNWLAEAQALAGATTEALATVEEALIANPEELAWRGDALRVRGGLHLTLGHKDAAEADIREAIVLAHKTNAKAWELRAALDLAQILKARSDIATACGLPVPLCAKFTEGSDTAGIAPFEAPRRPIRSYSSLPNAKSTAYSSRYFSRTNHQQAKPWSPNPKQHLT